MPGAEITLEANPGECTVDRLQRWLEAGVNRLSIGVQSLDDGHSSRLRPPPHRRRGPRGGPGGRARRGFDNLSLDFMLGLSRHDRRIWLATLDAAVALGPSTCPATS